MRRVTGDGVLASLTLAELGDRAFARNPVHVLTMHASKGLEFDVVCAVGLESTRLPRYRAEPWEIVQQRRQFYVTVTRARDAVHLFYTGWRNTARGRWDHGPSPWVDELLAT
jgi:DNA helicase-2/ATP-dependent DNA helicase PcrA